MSTITFPRKFGNYTLLEKMPDGGMGALYLGCRGDHGMEKLCVIKTVLPRADKEYRARFRDEAKVVVRLSHGNVVPVFDAGSVGDELYLAMEHVDGKDLRSVWNRCAQKGIAFPIDVAVYLARELARGLHHAHTFESIKLVHRDVSPPNVLLSFFGEIKLTDFGLASSTMKTEHTQAGVVYGKVSYMSPEQARGEPLDGRTDQYAVAVILWELLTGKQLFPSKDVDVMARVRDPSIEPPSKSAPRVPAALDAILLKALAKDRTLRYADCEAFRVALANFLAQNAPTTDNSTVAEFMQRLFGDEISAERAKRQRLLAEYAERSVPGAVESESDQTGSQPVTVTESRRTPLPGGNLVGSYLDGRYLVKKLIGEGGMGLVYEAEHVEIERRVAVKVLHHAYTKHSEVVARFRSEARAATRIGHPHIIDVFDSGTTVDGSVYFVMEFLHGRDLGETIKVEGSLPARRAVAIAREICQALAAAHKAGIIHRDMKPENVFLVERDGQKDFVKVLDFGIAKTLEGISDRIGRLTTPGMAMGTPEYMAPEQAAGAPADVRADVYAVGAILYEMLTSKPPHEGATVLEVLGKKASTPAAVETLRPDVPRELDRLVMRALALNPDERPQTMDALAAELGRLSGSGSTPQPIVPMTTDRVTRRRAQWPFAVVGAAVGLAAVAGVAIVRGRSTPKALPLVEASAPKTTGAALPLPTPDEVPPPPRPVEPPPAKKVISIGEVTVRPPKHDHPAAPVVKADAAALADARRVLADARTALRAGRYPQADALFEQVQAGGLEKGAALTGLAEVAFQRSNYSEAVRLAKKAAQSGGGVAAKMVLGNSYFRLEQYDDAITAYRDVLKVDGNHAEARTNLAAAEKRK